MNGEIDEAVAIQVRWVNVEFIPSRRDVEVPGGFEASLSIAKLPGDAGLLVKPIDFPVAIEIDQRIAPPLPRGDFTVAKLQDTRSRFVDPPFRATVLEGHLQVETSVFIEV